MAPQNERTTLLPSAEYDPQIREDARVEFQNDDVTGDNLSGQRPLYRPFVSYKQVFRFDARQSRGVLHGERGFVKKMRAGDGVKAARKAVLQQGKQRQVVVSQRKLDYGYSVGQLI